MPKVIHPKPVKSVAELRAEFWNAPDDALLDRKTVAAGIHRSIGWMELKAIHGGGIPFYKCGRRCLYRKTEVLAWLEVNSQHVFSTSELEPRRRAARSGGVRNTEAPRPSPRRGRCSRRERAHA